MTIQQALRFAGEELRGASDAPRLDAERLLLHVLKRDETSWLYAHSEERLAAAAAAQLKSLVQRRRSGEPLAYLIGEWEFYGRPFYITPAVLIPRPSTEELVDAALRYLSDRPCVLADVGTGSGCIAVTLVLEARIKNLELRMVATDISREALVVARRNAERHGVAREIDFMQGNFLEPLRGRHVDLIISNPPYVPRAELDRARENPNAVGLSFEPRLALDGGADGMRYVNMLRRSLTPAIFESAGGVVVRQN